MRIFKTFFAALLAQGLLAAPLLAEGKSIIVLDASGSMWGQIDGRPKLEIAREALGSVLSGLDPATEIGLMAYGHREKGSCEDIELVVPPAAGTAQAITDAANAMKFLGKTPLTEAVRRAAAELKSTEEKATVILITDGIETCEADPCALGAELEASGVDFTAHVVGFGLTAEEGATVACLAENTGGKYIQAKDAGSLVEALKTTVAVVEPEPVPEPEPTPMVLEKNFDPVIVLAEGQPEPADEIVDDAYVTLRLVLPDGALSDETISVYGRQTELVPPGTYRMFTELNDAKAEQEVTITADALAQPVANLNAGVLNLKLYAYQGGEIASEAFWEVRGPNDVSESGYGQALHVFPAGEYSFLASLGAAKVEETLTFEAGKQIDKDVIIGTGLAVVDATYAEGVKVEGGDHFVEIFGAAKDIDGNRKSVGYTYGAGAKFDLPAGDYVAVVTLGAAKVEVPFTVKVGERTEITAPLNAGVAAFTTPTDEFIEVLAAKPDINGDRASFGYSYGPSWQTTLPAGDYVVRASKDDKQSETPLSVKAGERTELALTLP
ncbi:VWA domain-containing protein [Tabrizicola sp.]|uniref:vWA domain-containing protein n=1 Tax=Tabrizicola sp. TaxID=2005166 RepID=UPI001A40A1FF|nr:VWA domain-containing protein [Tabrizicola sp.]MBL9074563.1 VWA domain-containing protein [Tabrizicola sp.]